MRPAPRTLPMFPGLGLLGLGLLLMGGCSRNENVVDTPPVLPDISIAGSGIFPESLTSGNDGSVYIGSIGTGQIYKVAAGMSVAEPFILPGSAGLRQVFGVFADDGSGTLWACSNDTAGGTAGPGALYGFDLASGAFKASYPLPAGGFCNDIAVGANGDLYATDTSNMQLLRLRSGGNALEVWSAAGAFGPANGALDGVAVVGGRVIVGTIGTGKLYAVGIGADGKATTVSALKLSEKLVGPDGMRAYGSDGLLLTDARGKVRQVVIAGDTATITTVKKGLKGLVSVTAIGKTAYALEGQLALRDTKPGGTPPAEEPYRAVAFTLP
ncbi:MAG: hypothetical protein QM718_04490 [Steroidobacteraceae bacterium]